MSHLIIYGEAGVGKSRYILENFPREENVFIAPTGMAACRLNCHTVHSFFGMGGDDRRPPSECVRRMSSDNKTAIELARNIIIDEAYTLPLSTARKINQILYLLTNQTPFGKKNIVLVGDPAQLPSVREPYIGSELFKTLEWSETSIDYEEDKSRLVPEYREFCNHFRDPRKPNEIEKHLKKLDFPQQLFPLDPSTMEGITVYYTNAEVKSHNDTLMDRFDGDEVQINNRVYKKGCPIILRQNTLNSGIFNGFICRFINYSHGMLTIHDGMNERTLDGYNAIEPAFAITIHKVQGLTLPNINILLRKKYAYSKDFVALLYVALTRVRDHTKCCLIYR